MFKYVVVYFDRYDTNKSVPVRVSADSPQDAIEKTKQFGLLDGLQINRIWMNSSHK